MAKSNEPIVWSLFSAGGVVTAFVVPVLILMLGLAVPLGWVAMPNHDKLLSLVMHPIIKLALFVLVCLSLVHWSHRFRFMLVDLGLKKFSGVIAFACYGTALVGCGYSSYLLLTL